MPIGKNSDLGDSPVTLAYILRAECYRQNVSLMMLAHGIGITRDTIYRLARGNRPALETLVKLHAFFPYSMEQLVAASLAQDPKDNPRWLYNQRLTKRQVREVIREEIEGNLSLSTIDAIDLQIERIEKKRRELRLRKKGSVMRSRDRRRRLRLKEQIKKRDKRRSTDL